MSVSGRCIHPDRSPDGFTILRSRSPLAVNFFLSSLLSPSLPSLLPSFLPLSLSPLLSSFSTVPIACGGLFFSFLGVGIGHGFGTEAGWNVMDWHRAFDAEYRTLRWMHVIGWRGGVGYLPKGNLPIYLSQV